MLRSKNIYNGFIEWFEIPPNMPILGKFFMGRLDILIMRITTYIREIYAICSYVTVYVLPSWEFANILSECCKRKYFEREWWISIYFDKSFTHLISFFVYDRKNKLNTNMGFNIFTRHAQFTYKSFLWFISCFSFLYLKLNSLTFHTNTTMRDMKIRTHQMILFSMRFT